MKASTLLRSFLLGHMISTWTYLGGRGAFNQHARLLKRVRPLAEPVLLLVGGVHLLQGMRTVYSTPVPLFQNRRFLSGCALLLFLEYHLDSLRLQRHFSLFDATQHELHQRWYLFEIGLLALSAHTKEPWIGIGFGLPPLLRCLL